MPKSLLVNIKIRYLKLPSGTKFEPFHDQVRFETLLPLTKAFLSKFSNLQPWLNQEMTLIGYQIKLYRKRKLKTSFDCG